MNNVLDRYTLELEALSEHENGPQPIQCVATNTDDNSAAEAWLTREEPASCSKCFTRTMSMSKRG